MMENKGCITCRKCEQVRSNFFCGRTRLSQKQLYNKHGFCSDYEPKEQIEKPMTNEEWFCQLSTEEKAKWMAKHMSFCEVCEIQTCRGDGCQRFDRGSMTETDAFREWLKEIHND